MLSVRWLVATRPRLYCTKRPSAISRRWKWATQSTIARLATSPFVRYIPGTLGMHGSIYLADEAFVVVSRRTVPSYACFFTLGFALSSNVTWWKEQGSLMSEREMQESRFGDLMGCLPLILVVFFSSSTLDLFIQNARCPPFSCRRSLMTAPSNSRSLSPHRLAIFYPQCLLYAISRPLSLFGSR